jgi:hypothetical protein
VRDGAEAARRDRQVVGPELDGVEAVDALVVRRGGALEVSVLVDQFDGGALNDVALLVGDDACDRAAARLCERGRTD